jgi:hypothetical protein
LRVVGPAQHGSTAARQLDAGGAAAVFVDPVSETAVNVVATSWPEETESLRAVGPLQSLILSLGSADPGDRSALDRLELSDADRVASW